MPSTVPLSNLSGEFKTIEKQFLDGWPDEMKSQIRVDAIHKINNPSLESRYQQFVCSNTKFATQECIGWHGTSTKFQNGSCMSSACSLCQIVQNGFEKDCPRTNTSSYKCWGAATYFANRSFVCHTYNGGSQINNGTTQRYTIMTKIHHGHTLHRERLKRVNSTYSGLIIAYLLKKFKYDTVRFYRDYYIAPVDYILVYNNLAAVPTYIVVYSYGSNALQIRTEKGDYCSFHNEYHSCAGGCDGHVNPPTCMTCRLVPHKFAYGAGGTGVSFDEITDPHPAFADQLSEILEILGETTY